MFGHGRDVDAERVAGDHAGVEARGEIGLQRTGRVGAAVVHAERRVVGPGRDRDGEAEAAAAGADLLDRAVGDARAGQIVHQQQRPLHAWRAATPSSAAIGASTLLHAEPRGALALHHDVGDPPLDHPDADAAALDVLRRHDGAAQVKARRAIEVADPAGDRHQVGLRHGLADETAARSPRSRRASISVAPSTATPVSRNSGLVSALVAGCATCGSGTAVLLARRCSASSASKRFSVRPMSGCGEGACWASEGVAVAARIDARAGTATPTAPRRLSAMQLQTLPIIRPATFRRVWEIAAVTTASLGRTWLTKGYGGCRTVAATKSKNLNTYRYTWRELFGCSQKLT